MKILRSPRCSFSKAGGLELNAPRSWGELSQDQLRYVLTLLGTFESPVEVKAYMLLRFCGIHVAKKLPDGARCFMRRGKFGRRSWFNLATWQVQSLIHQFDYIDSYDTMGVRLERVCGCHAVDVKLTDLTFIDYLNAEACYQGFLRTRNPDRLRELGRILYRDGEDNAPKRFEPDMVERLGCFCWFTYAKAEFARQFPHFFKPVPNGGGEADFLKLVNAQIRALTGGDVTKEKEIEQIPCWRALTELNEKAREAEEFNAKYG